MLSCGYLVILFQVFSYVLFNAFSDAVYICLFESITGEQFEKADVDSIAERIEKNVTEYLK